MRRRLASACVTVLVGLSPALLAADGAKTNSWVGCEGNAVRNHTAAEQTVLAGHPRVSYEDIKDIDAMAAAIRGARPGLSMSRDWWRWDRLLTRTADHRYTDRNALKILRAVLVGGILDRYQALAAKGEGDLVHLFFLTRSYPRVTKGYPRYRGPLKIGGHMAFRELHGGCGPHAGWGGAARMRIYQALVRQNMLTQKEQGLFKKLVHQSFSAEFIDFKKAPRGANNHAFGNVGGIALALKMFPDVPQANEARAWLDDVLGNLTGFGDWKEWTYYPYGPIFLHGLVDLVENGKLEKDRELVYAIGRRCLGFVHGGGVRGNPNAGSTVSMSRARMQAMYANPWQMGYYNIESSARDGHFWYRMAKFFKDPEFLWAAVQVNLGGRSPAGKVPPAWQKAYNERYRWFINRNLEPKVPQSRASIGYLSPLKHKIPERLYLLPGKQSGWPFVSFFLYDKKEGHLDNLSGHLYEYVVDGAKFLGTSGKYNALTKGGGTGEESLDLFLVMKGKHKFPLHPDQSGGGSGDYIRKGSIQHVDSALVAENNDAGDSYGRFAFDDYYGRGSRWKRQVVLTAEGCLVVRDQYDGGKDVDGYQAGPCWLLSPEPGWNEDQRPDRGPAKHDPRQNWFDAPSWDQAWWQTQKKRVLLYVHPGKGKTFGVFQQDTSRDITRPMGFEYYPTRNSYAKATVKAGKPEVFLSVLVPHHAKEKPEVVVQRIKSSVNNEGDAVVQVGDVSHSNPGRQELAR